MHEMQTIVTDVRGVCPSRGSTVCGAFVQPLPNYFGLLFCHFCARVGGRRNMSSGHGVSVTAWRCRRVIGSRRFSSSNFTWDDRSPSTTFDSTVATRCRRMVSAGVCVRYAVDETKPTGVCCLCFVDGVRSSVTDIGASKQLVPEHLSSSGTRDLMDRAVCLFVECYQLGCCFDIVHDVGLYALENDRLAAPLT